MQPRIAILNEKKLVGKRIMISMAENKTKELWISFYPFIELINNRVSTDLISLQVYEKSYFYHFNPTKKFEKWAAAEVKDFDIIPNELEKFLLLTRRIFNGKSSCITDTFMLEVTCYSGRVLL